MRSDELSIRPAGLAESDAIAPLLAQLGNPTPAAEVRGRLKRSLAMPNAGGLVAELGTEVVALACFYTALGFTQRPHRLVRPLADEHAAPTSPRERLG